MKKRALMVLTAILVTLTAFAFARAYAFPAEPATPTAMNLSMADAITAAQKEMMQREQLSAADIQNHRIKANFVKLENNEYAWMVLLESNEITNRISAIVTVDPAAPAIMDYQASTPTSEITIILINQWSERKGPMNRWSVEDKALFNLLFGWVDVYAVPGENHISKEEAKNIALAALPRAVASPECLFAFRLLSYTDGRADEYIWGVTIVQQGKEKYLVNVSAVDGSIVEMFELDGPG